MLGLKGIIAAAIMCTQHVCLLSSVLHGEALSHRLDNIPLSGGNHRPKSLIGEVSLISEGEGGQQ